jgi:hypothetical protein
LSLIAILIATSYLIFSAITRPEILILWTPTWLITLPAVGIMLVGYYSLFPSGGLQVSDKARGYHTRALYEKTLELFSYLRSRVGGDADLPMRVAANAVRLLTLVSVAVMIALKLAAMLFTSAPTGLGVLFAGMMGVSGGRGPQLAEIAGLSAIWLIAFHAKPRPSISPVDKNFLSVVQTYREYAQEVVFRVREGALGKPGTGIVVCIDELDKVTDLADIKAFIKVVKALFELDGSKYYLSIADDALVALTLGSVVGKSDFDSSFDHIERVAPLSFQDAVKIADDYLRKQTEVSFAPPVARVLAFLSFGVPRDVLRKCDLLLASTSEESRAPLGLLKSERAEKAEAAYAMGYISGAERLKLCAPSSILKNHLDGSIRAGDWEGPRGRLLAYVSLLFIAEAEGEALFAPGPPELLFEMYSLGYDLAIIPVEDLHERLSAIWSLISPVPAVGAVQA